MLEETTIRDRARADRWSALKCAVRRRRRVLFVHGSGHRQGQRSCWSTDTKTPGQRRTTRLTRRRIKDSVCAAAAAPDSHRVMCTAHILLCGACVWRIGGDDAYSCPL